MIRYSSNTFRHRIALLCDGPKIRPKPSSNRGNQPRFAVFCAENIMDPNRAKGVGHRGTYTIVAYDITDHRRLQHVAKICEDYGMRVQYSVFECRLEADKFDRFWNDLLATIDSSTDRLVAYKVCVACARDIRSAGTQTHQETVVA